jgi:hypothetical protein
MCIYTLKSVIEYYRCHGSTVFTCYLDASKAFDRVNHWHLFKKLFNRGVPSLIVRLLSYWYRTQEFCVKWGTVTSSVFLTKNGVRQGGILSPRLFALYMDDLSRVLQTLNAGCYVGSMCVNHLFYADDICLLAPSALGLQLLLNACESYGISHDILYNPSKSNCVVVPPRKGKHILPPSVFLNGNNIGYVDNVKYLGVILNKSLDESQDIKRQLRSLYASANTILLKFAHCSVSVKCRLVETFCLNFYCPYLWRTTTKQALSKLRVAYNNIYRRILGYNKWDSASNMFVSHRIDSFDARLRKACFSFVKRLNCSSNVLIDTLQTNNWCKNNYLWRHWRSILYLS